jgi:hypothetical protein
LLLRLLPANPIEGKDAEFTDWYDKVDF